MIRRVRASITGFALPGLRKENLEFLRVTCWGRVSDASG